MVLGCRGETRWSRVDGGPLVDLLRLEPDGRLDSGFGPKLEENYSVSCYALQPDGKVVIGYSYEVSGAHELAQGSWDVLVPKRRDR